MQNRQDKLALGSAIQKFNGWLINFQNRNKFEIKNFLPWICKLLGTSFELETIAPQNKMILGSLILEFQLDLNKVDDKYFFADDNVRLLIAAIKEYSNSNSIFIPHRMLLNTPLAPQLSNPNCIVMNYIKIADDYFEKNQKTVKSEIYYITQLKKDLTALKFFDEQIDINLIEEFERVVARINSYFYEIPLSFEPRLINEVGEYQKKKRQHPASILAIIQSKTNTYLASLQKHQKQDEKIPVIEDLLRIIISKDVSKFNKVFHERLKSLNKSERGCCRFWRSDTEIYIESIPPLIYQYFSSLVRGNTISI